MLLVVLNGLEWKGPFKVRHPFDWLYGSDMSWVTSRGIQSNEIEFSVDLFLSSWQEDAERRPTVDDGRREGGSQRQRWRHRSPVQLWRAAGLYATQHPGAISSPLPATGNQHPMMKMRRRIDACVVAGDVDRGAAGRPPRKTRQLRRLIAHVGDLHLLRSSQFQEPGTAAGWTQDARVCPSARPPAAQIIRRLFLARPGQSHSSG